MATIGQTLSSPESGWKRIDDTNAGIAYQGLWNNNEQTDAYNGSRNSTTNMEAKIQFRFKGTQIRILGANTSSYSNLIGIKIDGVQETFSQKSEAVIWKAMNYEKIGLENKIHDVEIYLINPGFLNLDAIDIDTGGEIISYTIKTRLEDMVIGDKIECDYDNPSTNTFGVFIRLGTALMSNTTTTDKWGIKFNFIYVGKDFKGRMLLIADRNIQHSISWDTLNTAGVATKDGVEITSLGLDPAKWKTNIRLLTGGTSSANAATSEWDKYIVNGPVGSDNAVWNWSGMTSFTSSVDKENATWRATRGLASASSYDREATSTLKQNLGFRPVLVAESLVKPIQNKYLIQDGDEIKTILDSTWSTIGTAPATKAMFDQGLSISSLTEEILQQLNSTKPELLCWTDEANPTRHVTMTGDMWEAVSQELPTVELFTDQGIKDLRSIPSEAWNALHKDFDVVTYTNLVEGNQAVRVQAIPYPQLVFAETDFSIVEDLTITGAANDIKIIVSGDGGTTWKTYDSQWVEVNANLEEANTKGMTIASFNALTKETWALIGDNIRLAYYIENEAKVDSVSVQKQPSSIQTPSLDKISITYDELTIEGRLKDLEVMNAINLIKLQFKANVLMQASKYALHDLVVDTFETDTAITTSSDSSQIIQKPFNDPSPLEDGFISEITLDEFANFTRVTIS